VGVVYRTLGRDARKEIMGRYVAPSSFDFEEVVN
jgi:hypothetical protein